MCLANSARIRPGVTDVGNIALHLLWCTSGQGQFIESARTCPDMFIYLSRPCEHVYGIELKA